jgi:hypothetical protein
VPQVLPAAPPPVTLPGLTVRLLPGTDPSILQDLEHVRLARGAEPVALQVDLGHQRVLDGAGHVVAGPDAVHSIYLQSVVDKWRYIAALRALARAHPQALHSDWGDDGTPQAHPRPWISYTEALFVISPLGPARQLLVFGMGPNGHLNLLAPEPEDGPDGSKLVIAEARPPLGAEHIIAVTAADPQGIRALITWFAEGNVGGPALIDTQGEILKQIAALKDVRVGVVGAYSCRMPAECAK